MLEGTNATNADLADALEVTPNQLRHIVEKLKKAGYPIKRLKRQWTAEKTKRFLEAYENARALGQGYDYLAEQTGLTKNHCYKRACIMKLEPLATKRQLAYLDGGSFI